MHAPLPRDRFASIKFVDLKRTCLDMVGKGAGPTLCQMGLKRLCGGFKLRCDRDGTLRID
jgi:hypothetical protein